MSSDDGGVGMVSSSVRRTRSSRGAFFGAVLDALAAGRGAAALRDGRGRVAAFAFGRAAFRRVLVRRLLAAKAGRRALFFALGRLFAFDAAARRGRLAERFGAGRPLSRFAGLLRRVAFRLAMADVLSEP
jgi:hypothetical protein